MIRNLVQEAEGGNYLPGISKKLIVKSTKVRYSSVAATFQRRRSEAAAASLRRRCDAAAVA